jgi:membrane protein implicated in regulation of membrane protease activity
MVGVFIFGLAVITIMMGVMKTVLDLQAGQILGFAVVPFLIMIVLEAVFLRLLFGRRRRTEKAGESVELKGEATKELDAGQARALPEPVSSVTEHTTRAFDPIYTDRNKR